MKNIDFSFKIVVAVVLAGVVIAFASPGPASKHSAPAAKPAVTHASADSAPASANSTE